MHADSARLGSLLRTALPTIRHAVALVDRVVGRLGERALVLSANEGRNRAVHVRSGGGQGLLVPWPLLVTSQYVPSGDEVPYDEDEIVSLPPPGASGASVVVPLHGFRPAPGSLTLHDGPAEVGAPALTVAYRFDGRVKDTTVPEGPDAFPGLASVLNDRGPDLLDRLAEHVASIDLGRHGPVRVLVPRVTSLGVAGVWPVAAGAIRTALASGRAPAGSFWAVADGYDGKTLVFGASRDATIAAWRREVERVRPKPPPPFDPTAWQAATEREGWGKAWAPNEEPDLGTFSFVGRGWDAPAPDLSPAAVPAAVVRVAACPASPPARGTWTRWLGGAGTTTLAVRVPSRGGFTLIGEHLLARFPLDALEDRLDAVEAAYLPREEAAFAQIAELRGTPPAPIRCRHFTCVDPATKAETELRVGTCSSAFDPRCFDGAALRGSLVRVRTGG